MVTVVAPGDDFGFPVDLLREVPRQQRAIRAIAETLEAAREILVSLEIPMSISDLARVSGVSKGTIYRYFEDVDAVVQTLAIPYAEAAVARVEERMNQVSNTTEISIGLSDLLGDIIRTCRRDPVALALLIGTTKNADLGTLYNDTVWRITDAANAAVEQYQPMPEALPGERRRQVGLGFHFVRSMIELSVDMDDAESKLLYTDFGVMMYRASAHDPALSPDELDPYAAGVLEAKPPTK